MVGDTPYNILSTLVLGNWRTVLTDGVSIENLKNGFSLVETMMWISWLKVKPTLGKTCFAHEARR